MEIKSLSVINLDHHGTVFVFFEPSLRLMEALEPAMGNFDNPAASMLGGMTLKFNAFLAAPLGVGNVAFSQNRLRLGCPTVARVCSQGASDADAMAAGIERRPTASRDVDVSLSR